MKLRLMFRQGIADYNGSFAGYRYASDIVEIPDDSTIFELCNNDKPEVVAGEWIEIDIATHCTKGYNERIRF